MSNITKPILLDETGKQIAAQLAMIAKNTGGIEVTDWKMVQYLVRMGVADKVFHIGDQFTVNKGATSLVFDVIGIDQDIPADPQLKHSLTLGLHNCYKSLQFDAKEAFYYAENPLPAGTYYFTVGDQPWFSGDAGKSYQFTLTQQLPAGGQLVLGNSYNATMNGAAVIAYASGSATTEIERATMSQGTSGTGLGTLKSAGDVEHSLNSIQRALLGSNNWGESALRQYLNSKATAGSVWKPQTKWDRPPAWNTSDAGFMNGLDEDFIEVVQKAIKTTVRNTVCEDGTSYTTEDKFFLLSRDELFMGPERSAYPEGSAYDYYRNFSDYSTPNTGADSNRVKYVNGSATYWWQRTPYAGIAFSVRRVYPSGAYDSSDAYGAIGVVPACIIA